MRFILSILLIAVLCFLAGLYLPWWSIAIIAFAVALFIPQGIGAGFLSGFIGVFLLWALLATWIDIKNENILSHKIAQLLPLGGSSALLILVTALVGGLVGGFAAMAGSSMRPVSNKS
jgi:MFS family permease